MTDKDTIRRNREIQKSLEARIAGLPSDELVKADAKSPLGIILAAWLPALPRTTRAAPLRGPRKERFSGSFSLREESRPQLLIGRGSLSLPAGAIIVAAFAAPKSPDRSPVISLKAEGGKRSNVCRVADTSDSFAEENWRPLAKAG